MRGAPVVPRGVAANTAPCARLGSESATRPDGDSRTSERNLAEQKRQSRAGPVDSAGVSMLQPPARQLRPHGERRAG